MRGAGRLVLPPTRLVLTTRERPTPTPDTHRPLLASGAIPVP
jgi:hypothetical protein